MIKMIFDGGYTYMMAEAEFIQIITLAGIGAAAMFVGCIFVAWMLIKMTINDFRKKRR